MNKWTTQSIPDLADKIVIVTGANSEPGFETTLGPTVGPDRPSGSFPSAGYVELL